MSSDATGILAYGFDLGVMANLFPWHYDGDIESGGPPWYDRERDYDYRTAAERALLVATGQPDDLYDSLTYQGVEAILDRIGVRVVQHGSDEGDEMGLLVAKVIRADWGDTTPVDLTLPDDADERLVWALGVLGIKPEAERPAWLLAAYYG